LDAGKCIGYPLELLVLISYVEIPSAHIVTFFSTRERPFPVIAMEWKKVLIAGIAGGILLFIAQFGFSFLANLVAPFDIFAIGGMRARNDPIMLLFFAYPFVLSFMSAIVFDRVKGALGESCCGGIDFGLILFLLVTVPGMFVIYSSMNYPLGFYLGNILFGIIGFPAVGLLYGRIWGV
jgi:hypothetical protein